MNMYASNAESISMPYGLLKTQTSQLTVKNASQAIPPGRFQYFTPSQMAGRLLPEMVAAVAAVAHVHPVEAIINPPMAVDLAHNR